MTFSRAEFSHLSLLSHKLEIAKYILYIQHSPASQGCYGVYDDLQRLKVFNGQKAALKNTN